MIHYPFSGTAWMPFMLLLLLLGMATTIFWIVMLVSCIQRVMAGERDNIPWLIVVVLFNFLGAALYYFLGRNPSPTLPDAAPPKAGPSRLQWWLGVLAIVFVGSLFVALVAGNKIALVLLLLVLELGLFVFWIWALVDCIRRISAEEKNRTTWIVWLVVIVLTNVVGAFIYCLVNHFGKNAASSSRFPPNQPPTPPPAVPPVPPPFAAKSSSAACPKCGAPLGADAPEGLCPRCLLQMNLSAPTQFTGAPAAGLSGGGAPPPPPAPPEEIAKHFPQLEILECLGRGGMGVVYKARQPKLNRLVALKILAPGREQDPQFAERFLREAQALAKLNHPNIVTIYDFGESDGLYFLLMEYVDGVTLRGLLAGGKVAPEQALAIVPRICEALQFAHEHGVVHRDIKPENILMDKQGRVKIADFGIARMLGVEGLPAHTRDRYVIGTPYYMAPEQVEKPLSVDHRADIYSLGVVFYEMLTGELPLGRFALPSQKVQVDVRLDDVVLRALEKEPQLRYQQASQVKTAVENISGVNPVGAAALGAGVPPSVSAPVPPQASPLVASAASDGASEEAPRFSRRAIIGALWVPFFIFLGVLGLTYHVGSVMVAQGEIPSGPSPREKVLMLVVVVLGVLAPFGTTILGWVAVGDIRRSAGKIYGLWLALFDGLFFPLLILDGLIAFLGYLATIAVWGGNAEVPNRYQAIWAFASLLFSLIADGLIFWLCWRAASRPASATAAVSGPVPTAANAGAPPRKRGLGTVIVVLILLLVFVGGPLFALLLWSNARRARLQSDFGGMPSVAMVNAPAADNSAETEEVRYWVFTADADEMNALRPDIAQQANTTLGIYSTNIAPEALQSLLDSAQAKNTLYLGKTLRPFQGGPYLAHLGDAEGWARLDDNWEYSGNDGSKGSATGYAALRHQGGDYELWVDYAVTHHTSDPGGGITNWKIGYSSPVPAEGWVVFFKSVPAPAGPARYLVAAFDVTPSSMPPLVGPGQASAPTLATPRRSADLNMLSIQLNQARAQLERTKPRYEQGLATGSELFAAQEQVEVLQAQIAGDVVLEAQTKLRWAQKEADLAQQLAQAGFMSADDSQKAKDRVQLLQAELARTQVSKDNMTADFASRLAAVQGIVNLSTRDQAFADLAKEAAQAGQAKVVENALSGVVNLSTRDSTASECVVLLAKAGQRDAALAVAQRIVNLSTRDAALAELAK